MAIIEIANFQFLQNKFVKDTIFFSTLPLIVNLLLWHNLCVNLNYYRLNYNLVLKIKLKLEVIEINYCFECDTYVYTFFFDLPEEISSQMFCLLIFVIKCSR